VSLHKMNSMISGTKSKVEQSNTSTKFWASLLADHFDAPEYHALVPRGALYCQVENHVRPKQMVFLITKMGQNFINFFS
jgi:hypothetical protein